MAVQTVKSTPNARELKSRAFASGGAGDRASRGERVRTDNKEGVVGRAGIVGKGTLVMKQAASGGIPPPATIVHAGKFPIKKAVVANGKGESSPRVKVDSGSSGGVEGGGEASGRSVSTSIGASTRKASGVARSINIVLNGSRPSPPGVQFTSKPANAKLSLSSSPSRAVARLPNPVLLALNPEAATAAIQPLRKHIVVTNTPPEDYEAEKEDEEAVGSWGYQRRRR
ncbi:hypothetical protein EYR38_001996 [Pleurotus pulmonarius]|nr:hypothetical protein EYR38_001996 [Pleurotus pulmonarius]